MDHHLATFARIGFLLDRVNTDDIEGDLDIADELLELGERWAQIKREEMQ